MLLRTLRTSKCLFAPTNEIVQLKMKQPPSSSLLLCSFSSALLKHTISIFRWTHWILCLNLTCEGCNIVTKHGLTQCVCGMGCGRAFNFEFRNECIINLMGNSWFYFFKYFIFNEMHRYKSGKASISPSMICLYSISESRCNEENSGDAALRDEQSFPIKCSFE